MDSGKQPDRFTLMSNAAHAVFATMVRVTYFFTCAAALFMTYDALPGMWNRWFGDYWPFQPRPDFETLSSGSRACSEISCSG